MTSNTSYMVSYMDSFTCLFRMILCFMTFTSGSVEGHYLQNVRTGESVWPAWTKLVQVVEHGVLAEQF